MHTCNKNEVIQNKSAAEPLEESTYFPENRYFEMFIWN